MNKAKKKYKKQCKSKIITFYKKDKDILELANSINFQKEVKDFLRRFLHYKNVCERNNIK